MALEIARQVYKNLSFSFSFPFFLGPPTLITELTEHLQVARLQNSFELSLYSDMRGFCVDAMLFGCI